MSAPQPARGAPQRVVLEGRYARLEPIGPQHVASLFDAAQNDGERFTYLFDEPPNSEAAMGIWVQNAAARNDPLMYAVIDKAGERAEGRQALMRIVPEHGVI